MLKSSCLTTRMRCCPLTDLYLEDARAINELFQYHLPYGQLPHRCYEGCCREQRQFLHQRKIKQNWSSGNSFTWSFVPFHKLYQIDVVIVILVPTLWYWNFSHRRVMAIIHFTWLVVYGGNEVVFWIHLSFMWSKNSTRIQVPYRIVGCQSDSGVILLLAS